MEIQTGLEIYLTVLLFMREWYNITIINVRKICIIKNLIYRNM